MIYNVSILEYSAGRQDEQLSCRTSQSSDGGGWARILGEGAGCSAEEEEGRQKQQQQQRLQTSKIAQQEKTMVANRTDSRFELYLY